MFSTNGALTRLVRLLALQGGVVALGFVFTIVVTRMMGIESYGQISYVIAIGNIMSAAMRYGTDETLIVSMTHADSQRSEIEAVTVLRAGFYLVAAVTLSVLWLWGLLTGKEALAAAFFLLIGLQVVAQFDYLNEQHKYSYTMIGNKTVLLLIFAALASTTSLGALEIFMAGTVFANVGLLMLHYGYFRRNFASTSPKVAWEEIVARVIALLYSNHLVMFASLMSLGLYSANQIYIKFALSYEALAIFAVQWQVCNVFLVYMKQVNRIYKPILAAQYRDVSNALRITQWKFGAMVTLPPTLFSMLIWLNYDAIFPRLFTQSLEGYGNVFLLLTVFIFLRGIHLTLTQICFVAAQNHVPFIANSAGVLLIGIVVAVLQGYDQIEDGVIAMNVAMLGMILMTLCFLKPISRLERARD